MILGILIGACMPCGFRLHSRPWAPLQVSGVITVVAVPPAWTSGHVAPRSPERRTAAPHTLRRHPSSLQTLALWPLHGRRCIRHSCHSHLCVCEPFRCTEGVSATNFPRGLGGRKRDQENLSICHHQVQQSFCIALAIEDFCSLYQYWPQLIKLHED